MRYAYITLLSSEDYFIAVKILNQNLKNLKCKYPLLVMVTQDIIFNVEEQLKREKILYKVVPVLEYSSQAKGWYGGVTSTLKTASKINLFKFTEYDKLVYLDADSFFLQNPDELFNYPDGAMYEPLRENESGFSGLFVCNPQNHCFDYYYTLLQKYPILDGDLFARLWFPYITRQEYHIPKEWFIHFVFADMIPVEEVKGVHFCNVYKPWNYMNPQEYIADVDKIVQSHTNNGLILAKKYMNLILDSK